MEATRCPACGETRWHLTALPVERATACALCGEDLMPERRLPGRRMTTSNAGEGERRGATSSTPLPSA
jgi:hypothetical protein